VVLVSEGVGEVEGEVGDGVGLDDGLLQFVDGDGGLLLYLVDNGNKIISLCFLL
jgi:hypothetical protein